MTRQESIEYNDDSNRLERSKNMGVRFDLLIKDIDKAITSAVSKSDGCKILWKSNAYVDEANYVSRGFKVIIGVDNEGQENSIKEKIQSVLNNPVNFVGGYNNIKPHPYKLKIKTIHTDGTITLNKHKITDPIRHMSKQNILDWYQESYEEEVKFINRDIKDLNERIVKFHTYDDKLPDKFAHYNKETIDTLEAAKKKKTVEKAELKKQRDHDIAIMTKELSDDGWYQMFMYKPKAMLYQMTYFDIVKKRRHREAVGDVVFAVNTNTVDETPHNRKIRSDSYEFKKGLLPQISFFPILEDTPPVKKDVKEIKVGK